MIGYVCDDFEVMAVNEEGLVVERFRRDDGETWEAVRSPYRLTYARHYDCWPLTEEWMLMHTGGQYPACRLKQLKKQ